MDSVLENGAAVRFSLDFCSLICCGFVTDRESCMLRDFTASYAVKEIVL